MSAKQLKTSNVITFKALKPELAMAKWHVEHLTGSADTVMNVRLFPDPQDLKGKGVKLRGKIEELWPEINFYQWQKWGVFIVVNDGGDLDKEITTIRAAFIDNDDPAIDLQKIKWHVPPAFLVHTSASKFHAYWPVNGLAPADFKPLQLRLAKFYQTDTAVSNPARVLRLAGTLHLKNPAEPFLVSVEDWSYDYPADITPDVLAAGLPAMDVKPRPDGYTSKREDAEWDDQSNLARGRDYLSKEVAAGHIAIEHDPHGHGGNTTLFKVAARLRDLLLTEATAADLIWADLNPKCSPPWRRPDDTFTTPIYRAYHGGAKNKEPGRDAIGKPSLTFAKDVTLEMLKPQPANTLKRFEAQSWTTFDKLPVLSFLFPHILPRIGGAVLNGHTRAGKTFIALDLAASVVTGEPAFGDEHYRPTETGVAFYVTSEDPYGVKAQRARGWLKHRGIDPTKYPDFYVIDDVPIASRPVDIAALAAEVHEKAGNNPVRIIVLDTLARMLPGLKENDPADMGTIRDACYELACQFNCIVLLLHHRPKGDKGTKLNPRGSGEAAAGFDTVLLAIRTGGDGSENDDDDGDEDDNGDFRTRLIVQKMRGGAERHTVYLDVPVIPIGFDDHGKLATTRVVKSISKAEFKAEAERVDDAEGVLRKRGIVDAAHGLRTGALARALMAAKPDGVPEAIPTQKFIKKQTALYNRIRQALIRDAKPGKPLHHLAHASSTGDWAWWAPPVAKAEEDKGS